MAISTLKYLIFLVILSSIIGCNTPQLTQQEKFAAYDDALERTNTLAEDKLQEKPEFVTSAIERISEYYDNVTIESVKRLTKSVYADDSFLCDTLHIANGAAEVQEYFTITAERVNSMRVNILDYSTMDKEIYARWTMTISADALADGKPVTSYGVSHFRLNSEGKVILHQDFWDASAGFFELLPGLEEVIQRLRGNM